MKSATADRSRDAKSSRVIASVRDNLRRKGDDVIKTDTPNKKESSNVTLNNNAKNPATPAAVPQHSAPTFSESQVNGEPVSPRLQKMVISISHKTVKDQDSESTEKSPKAPKTPPVVIKLHRISPVGNGTYTNQVPTDDGDSPLASKPGVQNANRTPAPEFVASVKQNSFGNATENNINIADVPELGTAVSQNDILCDPRPANGSVGLTTESASEQASKRPEQSKTLTTDVRSQPDHGKPAENVTVAKTLPVANGSTAKETVEASGSEHSYHKHGNDLNAKSQSRHHHRPHKTDHERSPSSSHHHHSHKHKHKHKHKHHRHHERDDQALPVPKVLKTGDGTSLKLKIEGLEAAKLSSSSGSGSSESKSHHRSHRHEKSSQSSSTSMRSSTNDGKTSSSTDARSTQSPAKEKEKLRDSRPKPSAESSTSVVTPKIKAAGETSTVVKQSSSGTSAGASGGTSSSQRHNKHHSESTTSTSKHKSSSSSTSSRSSSSRESGKPRPQISVHQQERQKQGSKVISAGSSSQKQASTPSKGSSGGSSTSATHKQSPSSSASKVLSSKDAMSQKPSSMSANSSSKVRTPNKPQATTIKQAATPTGNQSSTKKDHSKKKQDTQNFRPVPAAAAKKRKLSFEEAINTGSKKAKDEKAEKAIPFVAALSNATPSKKRSNSLDVAMLAGRGKLTPKKVRIEEQVAAYLYPQRLIEHDSKGSVMTLECDYALRNREKTELEQKFGGLVHLETHPNGGASLLHCYQDELDQLAPEKMKQFARDYFAELFKEEPFGSCKYVMGIIHGAAKSLPDLIEYFAQNYPDMTVKQGVLGKSDIDTTTMIKYAESVHKTYSLGTYRAGALNQISLVGTRQEEVGDYFPEFLDIMEEDPFLKLVMPWGDLSSVSDMPRSHSNDGPILWARPGEQYVPSAEMPKSPFKKRR